MVADAFITLVTIGSLTAVFGLGLWVMSKFVNLDKFDLFK